MKKLIKIIKKYENNDKNLLTDSGLNLIGKKMKEKFGLGIILTNNEIKYIMKVVKSLENRRVLLKGILQKLLFKKESFSIFLNH